MNMIRSVFSKLSKSLSRTRNGATGALQTLLHGKPLSMELLRQVERALIQADVGVHTAIELRKDIQAAWERNEITQGDEAFTFIQDQLVAIFPEEDRSIHFATTGPTVILVCGVNGAGKTTSIAKLCQRFHDEGRSVVLAAADTFRAAAVEQLSTWATRLGVQVIRGQQGGDPAAVAYDAVEAATARHADVLIIDTAGRLHTQEHLMRELGKIRQVVEKKIPDAPHEVLLVIDATTGQNGVNQAKAFTAITQVTGLLLSKLDGTAKGGIAIAIREQLNLPVKFIGTGETPQDLTIFDPASYVAAMFMAQTPEA